MSKRNAIGGYVHFLNRLQFDTEKLVKQWANCFDAGGIDPRKARLAFQDNAHNKLIERVSVAGKALMKAAIEAAPSDYVSQKIEAADRLVSALVETLSPPPAGLHSIYELPETLELQRCINYLEPFTESVTEEALSGDGEPHYPARYFDQFNISGDVLRKAKAAGRLRFRKVARHNHYSEPDAQRLWPDRFIAAKRESP